MSDEISSWSKFFPWIMSIVFGAGAGIGSAKVMLKENNQRIQTLENWVKNEGLTEKYHCAKCAKTQSDAALTTERIINAACEKMSEKVLSEIKSLHSRIDSLHNNIRNG